MEKNDLTDDSLKTVAVIERLLGAKGSLDFFSRCPLLT